MEQHPFQSFVKYRVPYTIINKWVWESDRFRKNPTSPEKTEKTPWGNCSIFLIHHPPKPFRPPTCLSCFLHTLTRTLLLRTSIPGCKIPFPPGCFRFKWLTEKKTHNKGYLDKKTPQHNTVRYCLGGKQ